ncbi:NAD(+) diphosphatase [Euzebya sp.]|uniref:NAD(+) diphosphatase n=1 Tax=Euzebya sp. TaxID=1971409 RepID=UPI00351177AD
MEHPDVAAALDDPSITVVVTRRRDGHVVVVEGGWPEGADVAEAPIVVAPGVMSVVVDDGDPLPVGEFTDARTAMFSVAEPEVLLGAIAFGQWRARERFCSRCAKPLSPARRPRTLVCPEGHLAFPRIEPAVIMRVVDADDRLLLARQPSWMEGRFSVLAGFVDPGERLEDTVRREVTEEVGSTVRQVDYVTSQPWPFPSSLMLAFHAVAETTDIRLDDDEIAEAEWFTREELEVAMGTGRVGLPPPLSVAHKLVSSWFGRPLATWTAGR